MRALIDCFPMCIKRGLAALLICSFVALASRSGSRVEYVGGTRPDIPSKTSGQITLTDETYFEYSSGHLAVKIPYQNINLLEYGQKVNRRYVQAVFISPLLLMAKKREHFLTVGFQDEQGRQQAMMFQMSKHDVRLTLVSLEARTGQQVQFQDEEARIAGKG